MEDAKQRGSGVGAGAGKKEKKDGRQISSYVTRNNGLSTFLQVEHTAGTVVLARNVLTLAWPSLAEQLFFGLSAMAVLMIVGVMGSGAIAGVGVANQLQWLFVSAFFALGAGATAIVARCVGGGDRPTAQDATRQAAMATMFSSVVLAAVGWAVAVPALRLMGLDAATAALATPYLRLIYISMIFGSVAMSLAAALRGAGDTRTPMVVNTVGTVLNVLLAYLLVSGKAGLPALGLTGAGLSFIVSTAFRLLAFWLAMVSGRCGLTVTGWSRYRPDPRMLARILRIGIPSAVEQVAMSVGILMFVRIVTSLGNDVYAAHQIAVNLTNLTFPITMGFGIAATALVGQSLGAGKPTLAEKYAYVARNLGFGLVTAISLSFLLFSHFYANLYIDDPSVTALSALALRIASLSQPGLALYSVLAGGLRGAGDTRWPLYLTLVGIWGVRLSLGYAAVLIMHLGLYGVWGAIACDQWARALLVTARFRSRRWQTMRV